MLFSKSYVMNRFILKPSEKKCVVCNNKKIFEVEAIHLKGLHFMIDMPDRKLLFCIEEV